MTFVLGLDIGSTTTKAALVEVTDEVFVVHVARRPTPSDVAALIETAATVSRECAAFATAPIAAVGIASMAETGAALDAEGRALTSLLRWDRPVDRHHLMALLSDHPDLPASTGIPATTKPTAVALAALRAEDREVHDAMRHWAGAADIVAHALTGVRATDHTLAARTMLAGRGDGWDAAVIESLGVGEHMLPALRAPGEPVGLTSAEASAFGLTAGIRVHIAGHDHAVGAWAAGARAAGDTADSLGTSEAIVRIANTVDVDRAVADGFSVCRTVDRSAWTVLGGSPACGALLERWHADYPDDRLLKRLGALTVDTWMASPVIVLPYLSGRQCPSPQPLARMRVFGRGDADERARGVLQSLIAQARWMREAADGLAGSPTAVLTVIGSLARRIPMWARLAAAPGTPARMCTVDEPVAAGAALLAAVRSGQAPPDSSILARDEVVAVDDPARDDTYRRFLTAATTDAATAEGES